MLKKIIEPKDIYKFWVVGIVLIYGLIMSEYFSNLNSRVFAIEAVELTNSSIYSFFISFSFFVMLITVFIIWLIFSFTFHLCAILLGGVSTFGNFLKYTGIFYIIPAIGFLIAFILSESINLPDDKISEFLNSNKTFVTIKLIINFTFIVYYILLVPIIKYLYKINWLKAIGAIAIPLGSIYLLGQFFSKFIF